MLVNQTESVSSQKLKEKQKGKVKQGRKERVDGTAIFMFKNVYIKCTNSVALQ